MFPHPCAKSHIRKITVVLKSIMGQTMKQDGMHKTQNEILCSVSVIYHIYYQDGPAGWEMQPLLLPRPCESTSMYIPNPKETEI